ncbi:hypothetical protein WISP_01393 [Willisornis vidua]|nr:hypothetical protein WISP_01393 [Willisornis vidua]
MDVLEVVAVGVVETGRGVVVLGVLLLVVLLGGTAVVVVSLEGSGVTVGAVVDTLLVVDEDKPCVNIAFHDLP